MEFAYLVISFGEKLLAASCFQKLVIGFEPMSDRKSGDRNIPVGISEKREFRCWPGTGVLGQIPVLVRHWLRKMLSVPFCSGYSFIVNFEKKNGSKLSIMIIYIGTDKPST